MKKILTLVVLFGLIFPALVSHAKILHPYHDLKIIKNVSEGDGIFNFSVTDYPPNPGFTNDFSITTASSTGSFTLNLLHKVTTENYFLSENAIPGWTLIGINCQNDVYGPIGTKLNNGIVLPFYGFTTTTCTVTNQKQNYKTPVLFVPGLLGTEIKKGDTLLWADIVRMVNPFNDDSFMDPLQLQPDMTPLDTSLMVDSVIKKKIQKVGLKEITLYDYTQALVDEFINQGYTEGQDLFTFPYDWRYGVSEDIVNQLKGQIDYILTQTDAGRAAGKVDVIAHSTGGLIVKKYVSGHPADHHIGKAVFVGVPNLGAPMALKVLLEGDNFGVSGLEDAEMKKIAQNMPVAYDLSPSHQYINAVGTYFEKLDYFNPDPATRLQLFDHEQTNRFLIDQSLANAQAINNSENLHSAEFDDFDVRDAGVDAYSIVGCKSGTLDGVTYATGPQGAQISPSKEITGDGTVPMGSADSIPTSDGHKFYAVKAEHGKMPSQQGIRQQIVNIIANSALNTGGNIITEQNLINNPAKCKLSGHWWEIFSPLSLELIDQSGNRSGIAPDGSIQNDIPGADYEVMREHKFIFVPTDEGQNYTATVKGTGDGSFTFKDETIDSGNVTQTQVFSNIPVNTNLTGRISLGDITTLSLDTNGDGNIEQTLQPTEILDPNQSRDLIPPASSSTTSGVLGPSGVYQGDVKISLSAVDAVIPGKENQTSGLLKIVYSLDGEAYQDYASGTPVSMAAEGRHFLNFYSTDRAGNNETGQKIELTIARPATEAPPKHAPPAVAPTAGTGPITGGSIIYAPAPEPATPEAASSEPEVLGTSALAAAHSEGSLIIFAGEPTVYLIAGGAKHPFCSAKQFLRLRYRFQSVLPAWPGDQNFFLGMPVA